MTPRDAVRSGAVALGCPLSEPQLDLLDRYAELIIQGTVEAGLTSLRDPMDIALKHVVDSLAVVPAVPNGAGTALDVGAGAGLPGIPLQIVRSDLRVTLLEATGKKAAWLRRTVQALGLHHTSVINGRAEDLSRDPRHRAAYDLAVARAVAPLSVLCELCLPFVRVGGRFVALKTRAGAEAETPAAMRAARLLGARLIGTRRVPLEVPPNRVLVEFEQEMPVPDVYPRRSGMAAKRPL